MEILKFKSMSSKFEPLPVVTPLGEPILKLNPRVLSLRYASGDSISEFFADGNTDAGTLIFTKRSTGATSAVYRDDGIEFNSAYGGNCSLPTGKAVTALVDMETLTFGTSRVLSIGTDSYNVLTLSHKATTIEVTVNHGTAQVITKTIPLNTRFKVGIIISSTETNVIIDGEVLKTFESVYPTTQNTVFILNGASAVPTPANRHKIHGLEIYSGIEHSIDDVIEYMSAS